jgi:hypothetical protein
VQRNSAILVTLVKIEEATTDAEEMITAVETTAEIIRIIVIGIVLSAKILTFHSELNVTDVENLREEVIQTNAEKAVEEMTEEVEMIAVEEMTEEIIEEIIPTMIGIVLSVKIQTSHSEQNVIDVENLREEEIPTSAEKAVEEMTEEVEMTAVEEMTGVETTVVTIQTMIGNAENVRTQTSPSEQNVIDVESQKVVEKKLLPKIGKVMTEDQVIEEESKPHAQETGIVHSVGNLILLREMTVSVVDALRE